ncbi:MAG: hypothetical protein AB7F40_10080, partial [Victivallaceae bacterium]
VSAVGLFAQGEPLKVSIGGYVNRIEELSLENGFASVDLWLWTNWTGGRDAMVKHLEISNGEVFGTRIDFARDDSGKLYNAARVQARVFCNFDLKDYPFDRQKVVISIEDTDMISKQLQFVPDSDSCGIDPDYQPACWQITGFETSVDTHTYNTDFGDPVADGPHGEYSRFNMTISLERPGGFWFKIFKYFGIVLISVALAAAALLVRIDNLGARFAMLGGALAVNMIGLFALIYRIPQWSGITIAELVTYLSLGFVLLFVLQSIISLNMREMISPTMARRFDRAGFLALLTLYVATLGLMLA